MVKRNTKSGHDHESLMTEIAHRYYIKKETQETIGTALSLPRMKVNRLLKQAQDEGIVEIRIKLGSAQTQFIEQQMLEKFNIKRVLIAPDSANPEQQRISVASLVSGYLEANLREGSVVAVGMGRNIAAVADVNTSRVLQSTIFVCATGGASEAGETGNADHICRKLALSFGGRAQTLYAPAYVPDPQLRRALLANDTVRRSFRQALHADYVLVGIGDLGADSHMVRVGWFSPDEIAKAHKKGV
ncbi:MAG: sugar-binding transcriptional regulator, partial [Devosiaceae bacterium]|nr:sugar-binding transcriptional regulator [Devosiaceae bacterium]